MIEDEAKLIVSITDLIEASALLVSLDHSHRNAQILAAKIISKVRQFDEASIIERLNKK